MISCRRTNIWLESAYERFQTRQSDVAFGLPLRQPLFRAEADTSFKDHFSKQAADYAKFRPRYPQKLFEYLGSIAPNRGLAWDCGTGNGQAAVGLATVFDHVIATDASEKQIANAQPHEHVEYRVAAAENSGNKSGTVDLIMVAQALHWFDLHHFMRKRGECSSLTASSLHRLTTCCRSSRPLMRW